MRKVHVEVIARHTADGKIIPLNIIWEEGRIFTIEKVLDVCQARSLKVGGQGLRYKCRIQGKETYMWLEDGKWFVEGK